MFWDNLQAACQKNGIRVSPLLNELKISTGSISRWQNGGAVSSTILLKISNRLGVSTDYLLTGMESSTDEGPVDLSWEEQDMLAMYRELPDGVQALCRNYVKAAHDTYVVMQGEKSKVSQPIA